MEKNIKELAAKAAEFCKVSEQNRDVWIAGYCAGFERGENSAYRKVVVSCAQMAGLLNVPQNNAKDDSLCF